MGTDQYSGVSLQPLKLPTEGKRRSNKGFSETMLNRKITSAVKRRCVLHPTRREMLQIGSLALGGLSLGRLLAAEARQTKLSRKRPSKSCIFLFLEGGPSHIDLWDMKPEAPDDVRGEFHPIQTTVPGMQVCNHLPLLAKQMHNLAIVRSVHHTVVDHNAGAYYALTGRTPFRGSRLLTTPGAEDFPPYGAVLSHLRPTDDSFPAFLHLPDIMFNNGTDLPGQRAGLLGAAYNPFLLGDPSEPGFKVKQMDLPDEIITERVQRRVELLRGIDSSTTASLPQSSAVREYQQQAYDLLMSDKAHAAFDLSHEPQKVRERYGLPDRVDRSVGARKFGGLPHMGQCYLMARKMVEAGTRLVTVGSGRRSDQTWDTHRDHFPLLKQSLLPYFDRAISALLEDMEQSGQLEETLIVIMGEFGRTPRLGQITSSAGADAGGRDHWPHCFSVLFAGGGIQGGAIYGSSDKHAAFPETDPVTMEDVAATIYYALGLEPTTEIHDRFGRPLELSSGTPIKAILS